MSVGDEPVSSDPSCFRWMKTDPPDDETLRRRGRTFSLREALLWITGLAIGCALPNWLAFAALPIVFYATLIAVAGRLSYLLSFQLSFVIGLCAAIAALGVALATLD